VNSAHIHLLTNHIPIIGAIFSLLLLIVAMLIKDPKVIAISLVFIVLTAIGSIPAYLSGEKAEDIVEKVAGISEERIEAHEEAAEMAFIVMLATGGIALITLAVGRTTPRRLRKLAWAPLLALIISAVLMGRAANLGGMIHHPEIRDKGSTQPLQKGSSRGEHEEKSD